MKFIRLLKSANLQFIPIQYQMDSRDDFFKSPAPKNLEYFYSPLLRVRTDDEQLFEHSLFSPQIRDLRSPLSAFTPVSEEPEIRQSSPKKVKKIPLKRQIAQKINFEQSHESEEPPVTPQKIQPKIVYQIQTTGRKKYDLRLLESNQKQQHIGKDSERGLRALSRQAYEILAKSEAMTYQEVAGKIIEENDEIGEYSDRQRQSIKRRVYDALNVLIAAGVLEKAGKKISISQRKQSQHKKYNSQKMDAYKQVIEKESAIFKKRQFIRKAKELCGKFKKLMNRNFQRTQEVPKDKKVTFPFLLFEEFNSSSEKMLLKINAKTTHNVGKFLGGDLDVIKRLDLGKKDF